MIKRYALTFLLVTTVLTTHADVLELNDGKLLNGTYMGGTSGTIRFDAGGGMQVYPVTSVIALTISRSGSATSSSQVQPSQPPVVVAPPAPSPPPAAQKTAPPSGPYVVPSGTQLKVKLNYTLSTASSLPGQKYEAVLVSDLRSGSIVVAPKGSMVKGTVTDVKAPRRIRKAASLAVKLDSVTVGSRTLRLSTNTHETETGPNGSIIKGAALGAVVGEIADDDAGDGAAYGAAAGAMKKGDHIEFKAGSIITFVLTSDLKVAP